MSFKVSGILNPHKYKSGKVIIKVSRLDWIKTILDSDIDVLIGQFQLGVSHNYKIIGKTLKRKEITTSCIAIKSIIAKNILWPKRQAGDYKFINKVKKNYKINHFDIIIAKAQIDMNRSWGRRKNH